ncbi:methyltransferase domain-containing protein [Haloprofundus marisrubri]|uniref:methyltransferase domain-containing protein n=1 Tax=Haloprofundus marisrubri TaxID=1514971 RepID=UPI0009E191ED|nr:methyltransferase domain-containing protein [Haloprofundus marisrubri]
MELAGEDDAFAAYEARAAAGEPELAAPGVAVARTLDRARARTLAYTHRASDLVGHTDASVESARLLLEAASLSREGTVAVRARDVRGESDVSTGDTERELGGVLVDRGYAVDLDDPDNVLRVVFADDRCFVGWQVVESIRDYGDRRPTDRPFFQPGSMAPLDARAFANIAGAQPGATILDPMCGTGGTLIEAGLVGATPVGVDAQKKMAAGARINLDAYVDGDAHVVRGDATALPLRDDAVDGVVFDAPYGRQSKIARHSLRDLVSGALEEAYRVAPQGVLVADRSWHEEAENAGWTVEETFERRVHRSLVRHVHVLRRDE